MCRRSHPQKTISTVNRSALSWSKRHRSFDPTKRALNGNFNTFSWEWLTISLHIGSNTIILLQFTGLTSLGIIPETFICKEQLFSRTKDELFATIDAHQNLVRVLVHLRFLPARLALLGANHNCSDSLVLEMVKAPSPLTGGAITRDCQLTAILTYYYCKIRVQPHEMPAIISLFGRVSSELSHNTSRMVRQTWNIFSLTK